MQLYSWRSRKTGMMWVVLGVIGAMLTGCGQDRQEGGEAAAIDSAIFTRTGLYLKVTTPAVIETADILEDGKQVASISPASGEALIDFDWDSGVRYDLAVTTDQTSLKMPVYAPDKPTPLKLGEVLLEDLDRPEMQYRYYASRGSGLCFSDDGSLIGVGTKGGYVYVVSVASREILWKHKIPEGRVTTVAFTRDGKLLAGEESRDGCLYCFDGKSGEMLWRYNTCDDFDQTGSKTTKMGGYPYYPMQLWGLCIDDQGAPFLMSRHNATKEIGGREVSVTTSMAYKFDIETGAPVWKFPIPTSSWGLTLSKDGKYVLPSIGWSKEAVLYVIDAASGTSLWQYSFTVGDQQAESFRGTTGFQADISPDSRHVVVNQVYPDETFVFDNEASIGAGEAQLLWQKKFLKVLDVSGVAISSSSVNLELTDTELIFATWSSRSMNALSNFSQLPAQHPDADTLFVYDYGGKLKWKWKLGDGIWNNECLLSANGRYMVIPIGLVPEHTLANPDDMGIYVFSPDAAGSATDRLNWFYHTEGFAYKAAISPDGKHIVVLEGPFDVDPDEEKENIVGKHRLIILS